MVVEVAVKVGAVTSATVTVELHVAVLPEASRTVNVIVFAPKLLQLKLVLLSESIKLPVAVQLSVEPLLTSGTVKMALPELFKLSVAFLHTAVGATLSLTVMVKLHGLLVFPLASATV